MDILTERYVEPRIVSRFRGCLLAGACGDALGAPLEFLRRDQILKAHGPGGVRNYLPAYGRLGAITDDTQMTLFTGDGLLRAYVRSCERGIGPVFASVTANAYLRWLRTQGERSPAEVTGEDPGWLLGHRELFNRRAPGNTCLSALRHARSLGAPASNTSKGCGGVMRVAPVGLLYAQATSMVPDAQGEAFQTACDLAHLTHGHPSGYLSAGAFAVLIFALVRGESLERALDQALRALLPHEGHQETTAALERARALAESRPMDPEALKLLGEGWVAEEALAIAVYCALCAPNLEEAVVLAANHDGDSDSTAAIAGNLLGARDGVDAVPPAWLTDLELRDVISDMADDLATFPLWYASDHVGEVLPGYYWRRYPGF